MRKYRIIMILCVMSLFLVACTNKNDKTKVKMEETQEMETAAVLEPDLAQIRSICDLATLECYYHNVAKLTKEKEVLWWDTSAELWIEYSGIVKLGVDIANLDMQVDGNQVTITMPKAEVLSCQVDQTSLNEDSYYTCLLYTSPSPRDA